MASRRVLRFDIPLMTKMFFITGTDTGVGKTVLTARLAEFLRREGVRVAALKPVCSGGHDDARRLQTALGGALTLDEINPWHFRAALAPSVAAQKEHRAVRRAAVLKHIRAIRRRFDVVLIEGAGGLLSPLGVDFNARDLISALEATPIIVAPNRLGVVNHLLLTLEALPRKARLQTRMALMDTPKPDPAAHSNAAMLGELARQPFYSLPWMDGENGAGSAPATGRTQDQERLSGDFAGLLGSASRRGKLARPSR
jgi:dethiobiotin synthetase